MKAWPICLSLRKLLAFCCLAAVLVAASVAVPAAADAEIIRVGGNRGYPPYEFPDKNGQPTGFTVELLRAIADVMGMTVDIRIGEWAKMHDDLAAGRIDMTLGMSYSEKREKIFDFASPHTVVQHAIFARRETPAVSTLADLAGKKVVVHRNGIMHERLKSLGFGKDLVLTETPADGLRLLASGENDYAVVALLPGMYIIRENKLTNLEPVARNVASFPFSFAVREGDAELLAHLNEGLAILKKTGQYQVIYDKWLGVLEPPRVSWEKVLQYGAMTLVPLVLLLTGTIIWSRTLQRKVRQRTEELAREVSEKEQALQELRLEQDKLIQADKMTSLGILVSGVAHEINNPNGLILLNVPTLKAASCDAEAVLEEHFRQHGDFTYGGLPYSRMKGKIPHLLNEMQEGAKRIKRIVDDLKDFARRDTEFGMEPIDLNAVVQASVRLVESSLRKTTDHFSVRYGDDLPPVSGNAQRIEQVIVNLLINACQALPDKSRSISVTTFHDRVDSCVVLQVKDEGVGIPPENISHLTDPFFTTKRESGGTGLGLSVSATIIKEHGGTLDFDSDPGRGTTVKLSLPDLRKGSVNA
ncbi:MAG TPA: transporter substrate-binding domain-containing protein [Desulfuromonadales bacterium]|nr:transporter substrate-binding domain-containing protein [Desulfuromonadales bacterium]